MLRLRQTAFIVVCFGLSSALVDFGLLERVQAIQDHSDYVEEPPVFHCPGGGVCSVDVLLFRQKGTSALVLLRLQGDECSVVPLDPSKTIEVPGGSNVSFAFLSRGETCIETTRSRNGVFALDSPSGVYVMGMAALVGGAQVSGLIGLSSTDIISNGTPHPFPPEDFAKCSQGFHLLSPRSSVEMFGFTYALLSDVYPAVQQRQGSWWPTSVPSGWAECEDNTRNMHVIANGHWPEACIFLNGTAYTRSGTVCKDVGLIRRGSCLASTGEAGILLCREWLSETLVNPTFDMGLAFWQRQPGKVVQLLSGVNNVSRTNTSIVRIQEEGWIYQALRTAIPREGVKFGVWARFNGSNAGGDLENFHSFSVHADVVYTNGTALALHTDYNMSATLDGKWQYAELILSGRPVGIASGALVMLLRELGKISADFDSVTVSRIDSIVRLPTSTHDRAQWVLDDGAEIVEADRTRGHAMFKCSLAAANEAGSCCTITHEVKENNWDGIVFRTGRTATFDASVRAVSVSARATYGVAIDAVFNDTVSVLPHATWTVASATGGGAGEWTHVRGSALLHADMMSVSLVLFLCDGTGTFMRARRGRSETLAPVPMEQEVLFRDVRLLVDQPNNAPLLTMGGTFGHGHVLTMSGKIYLVPGQGDFVLYEDPHFIVHVRHTLVEMPELLGARTSAVAMAWCSEGSSTACTRDSALGVLEVSCVDEPSVVPMLRVNGEIVSLPDVEPGPTMVLHYFDVVLRFTVLDETTSELVVDRSGVHTVKVLMHSPAIASQYMEAYIYAERDEDVVPSGAVTREPVSDDMTYMLYGKSLRVSLSKMLFHAWSTFTAVNDVPLDPFEDQVSKGAQAAADARCRLQVEHPLIVRACVHDVVLTGDALVGDAYARTQEYLAVRVPDVVRNTTETVEDAVEAVVVEASSASSIALYFLLIIPGSCCLFCICYKAKSCLSGKGSQNMPWDKDVLMPEVLKSSSEPKSVASAKSLEAHLGGSASHSSLPAAGASSKTMPLAASGSRDGPAPEKGHKKKTKMKKRKSVAAITAPSAATPKLKLKKHKKKRRATPPTEAPKDAGTTTAPAPKLPTTTTTTTTTAAAAATTTTTTTTAASTATATTAAAAAAVRLAEPSSSHQHATRAATPGASPTPQPASSPPSARVEGAASNSDGPARPSLDRAGGTASSRPPRRSRLTFGTDSVILGGGPLSGGAARTGGQTTASTGQSVAPVTSATLRGEIDGSGGEDGGGGSDGGALQSSLRFDSSTSELSNHLSNSQSDRHSHHESSSAWSS